MDPMILNSMVALAPVLICLIVFDRIDAFGLVSLPTVAVLLLAGGAVAAVSYYVNGGVLDQFPLGRDNYAQAVAPVIEECLKAVLLIAVFWLNRIGYLIDALIVGFAIGAGFSVAENMFYLHQFSQANVGVWLVRGFGTAIMHGGASALFAVITQLLYPPRLRTDASRFHFNPLLFIPGLALAIALHAAFNHFTNYPLIAMAVMLLGIPLGIFAIFALGETYAHRWLVHNRESHSQLQADIESGAFAASEEGRAIQALADRLDAKGASALMECVRLHAELVVKADINLLELEAHEAEAHHAHVRGAFQRLRALESKLGRSTVMALRQHLRFSRNDLWEMHELEAHAVD
jgi:RsiW-degrading membrane proteinase PrsW (M82 family)